jgi:hypothetical protein
MPIYYRRVRILAISRWRGTTDRLRIVIWAGAHGIFTRMLKIQFPAIMSRIKAAAPTKFSRCDDGGHRRSGSQLAFPRIHLRAISLSFELGEA